MKRKVLSLVLALVMCLGLAAPAVAAPASPLLDEDAAEAADAPRYAVYEAPYRINLENNTYASIVFTMAERGGNVYFENVVSISFYTTNPNGSHWKIVEHSYSVSDINFQLYVTVQDMEGDTPSSTWLGETSYTVRPSQVVPSRSADQDAEAVLLTPDSVNISFAEDMKNALPVGDPEAVLLTPDWVRVTFVGNTENVN